MAELNDDLLHWRRSSSVTTNERTHEVVREQVPPEVREALASLAQIVNSLGQELGQLRGAMAALAREAGK